MESKEEVAPQRVKEGNFKIGEYNLEIKKNTVRINYESIAHIHRFVITINTEKKTVKYRRYQYSQKMIGFDEHLKDNDLNNIIENVKKAIKEKEGKYIDNIISIVIRMFNKENEF